jgi:hypothetical protein
MGETRKRLTCVPLVFLALDKTDSSFFVSDGDDLFSSSL